ncbi:MAG: ferritin [Candidatus Helarchaeota archaeon]|nr:ferritin [Candidatus Helarchaeota archaeon]
MISKTLEEAINKQLNRELYSAYLYLSMAAYFESKGFSGFANWMRVQFQEETFHAMKFFDYVIGRGGRVTLLDIEAPPTKWGSLLDAFEYTYEHEQKVTGLINNLVKLATEENDYAAISMLQWYVNEQVEEEASASAIVDKLKMIGDAGSGLYMLDQELAQRVFTPPTTSE